MLRDSYLSLLFLLTSSPPHFVLLLNLLSFALISTSTLTLFLSICIGDFNCFGSFSLRRPFRNVCKIGARKPLYIYIYILQLNIPFLFIFIFLSFCSSFLSFIFFVFISFILAFDFFHPISLFYPMSPSYPLFRTQYPQPPKYLDGV